jgi:hypothetical protein
MPESRLIRFGASLALLCSLTHCTGKSATQSCNPGEPDCTPADINGAGGAAKTSDGGDSETTAVGGKSSTKAGASTGGSSPKSGSASEGGSSQKSGSGASPVGGSSVTSGSGASQVGGSSAKSGGSGQGGSSAKSGSGQGGSSAKSGSSSAGGTSATTGPRVDADGVGLAKPGDSKSGSSEYLNLGDIRLLNNKWGSDELGCNTAMKVYVANDGSIGWDFNRETCGGKGEKPDYPEIEFGIHPFGIGNALETSPPFSSTKLLPIQIKDITSASLLIDNLSINLQKPGSWNINFEMWLSERNPLTDPNPGVYAEIITFWGWEATRWPCEESGNVTSGDKSYRLCHLVNDWAGGKWRYIQFWVNGGPMTTFSGKLDAKAFLDWAVNTQGYSRDLWVTRFEVGSEIDDQTSGSVKVRNITFEVNGTSKSIELAQ